MSLGPGADHSTRSDFLDGVLETLQETMHIVEGSGIAHTLHGLEDSTPRLPKLLELLLDLSTCFVGGCVGHAEHSTRHADADRRLPLSEAHQADRMGSPRSVEPKSAKKLLTASWARSAAIRSMSIASPRSARIWLSRIARP